MNHSGRKLEKHLWLTALMGSLVLIGGSSSARAAGCHVSERPVLTRTLSWDEWRHDGILPAGFHLAAAPMAVKPLPCHGETPTLQTIAFGLVSADLPPVTKVETLSRTEWIEIQLSDRPSSSVPSRLDRPPRPLLGS